MTYPALFAIITGIGMIAMWMASYFSKQIPLNENILTMREVSRASSEQQWKLL